MSRQTKGKCKYCGKEYTRANMIKHLLSCKEHEASVAAETSSKKSGYFQLVISGKYAKAYWLIIEILEDATLKDLDSFLRDIWLECCGHLSAFEIDGVRYDVNPGIDSFWGTPVKNMNYKLKSVLQKGMKISYEYDFGSTTDLDITVCDYTVASEKKDKLTILSRNNPPEILCDECGEKKAAAICGECMHEDCGFLCEDCAETHECDVWLDICNSPRMGVCGYCGSEVYPEQFVPDKQEN